MNVKDRIKGSLYGIAVGDALGACWEGWRPKDIARLGAVTDMQDLESSPWALGEFTDDTWLTLATARAYDDIVFNPEKAANSMLVWVKINGKGCGRLTASALANLSSGRTDLYGSGHKALASSGSQGAGNGSLMRCASTGLTRKPDEIDDIIEESTVLSEITHADSRCVAACVGYNIVLANIIADNNYHDSLEKAAHIVEPINEGVSRIFSEVADGARFAWNIDNMHGMGYVNRALDRALVAYADSICLGGTFEDYILEVVNEGGDCDTNAAIAGGLLGARFGYSNIPQRWLDVLMWKDELDEATDLIMKFRENE